MGIWEVLTGTTEQHGDKVACSHWSPEEADREFGRDRPAGGPIYCDKCNVPTGKAKR